MQSILTRLSALRLILESKQFEQMQVELVLHPAARSLARNDVPQVGHWKHSLANRSRVGLFKALDPVGSEHEIKVKGSALELDEVFPKNDLGSHFFVEHKPKCEDRAKDAIAVLDGLRGEHDDILSGSWVSQQDGAALSNEQVLDPCKIECFGNLLCLKRIEWGSIDHSSFADWKPR